MALVANLVIRVNLSTQIHIAIPVKQCDICGNSTEPRLRHNDCNRN